MKTFLGIIVLACTMIFTGSGFISSSEAMQLDEEKIGTNPPILSQLNLKDKEIDDNKVLQISQNPKYARANYIDLSGNPSVTDKALEYIRDSNILGSLRELPQMSGRYGVPSSEIVVKIGGTNITEEAIAEYGKPRFDFSIHYRRAFDGMQISPSVINSLKLLVIEKF